MNDNETRAPRPETAGDQRFIRYLTWLEEDFASFPQGVVGDENFRLAVRFVYMLDCAVYLLSDRQLDRLLRILEALDCEHGFFSADATKRLLELPERDCAFLIARQIAISVADLDASVEEMVARWRRDVRFEAQPGGSSVFSKKPYRGLLIDRDLDEAQMDRLNAVPGVSITSTCAGHPERGTGPDFAFRTVDGRHGHVISDIVNTGTNYPALLAWWEAAIDRLERDPGALVAEPTTVVGSPPREQHETLGKP